MQNHQELLDLYRRFPCRTLPNAYWKTATSLDEGRVDITYGPRGESTLLQVWRGRSCLAFWCANPQNHLVEADQLDQLEFALVHEGSLPLFSEMPFHRRQPYFRMRHESVGTDYNCPPGFLFRDANPSAEAETVAGIIQRCYANMKVNSKTVLGWLDHPVYHPNLWIWMVEADTHRKAGLGIAELDPSIPEASLEWIQVLPEYQEQGLGTAIVTELLNRVEEEVQFTTVSGEMDNPKQPERLFRKCGFTGSDVWWLLKP